MIFLRKIMIALPWPLLIALCVTLGLAPYVPEPHLWEKLRMLVAGNLTRLVDIFDMAFHGLPWILVSLKLVFGRQPGNGPPPQV